MSRKGEEIRPLNGCSKFSRCQIHGSAVIYRFNFKRNRSISSRKFGVFLNVEVRDHWLNANGANPHLKIYVNSLFVEVFWLEMIGRTLCAKRFCEVAVNSLDLFAAHYRIKSVLCVTHQLQISTGSWYFGCHGDGRDGTCTGWESRGLNVSVLCRVFPKFRIYLSIFEFQFLGFQFLNLDFLEWIDWRESQTCGWIYAEYGLQSLRTLHALESGKHKDRSPNESNTERKRHNWARKTRPQPDWTSTWKLNKV